MSDGQCPGSYFIGQGPVFDEAMYRNGLKSKLGHNPFSLGTIQLLDYSFGCCAETETQLMDVLTGRMAGVRKLLDQETLRLENDQSIQDYSEKKRLSRELQTLNEAAMNLNIAGFDGFLDYAQRNGLLTV
ncbi:MAG: hypothetical protein JW754_02705 [Candidatus Aenigmarchaeota archaeon]|nr:hypothetical protein [Candidatus Aenigmarchaeota archaeon]